MDRFAFVLIVSELLNKDINTLTYGSPEEPYLAAAYYFVPTLYFLCCFSGHKKNCGDKKTEAAKMK